MDDLQRQRKTFGACESWIKADVRRGDFRRSLLRSRARKVAVAWTSNECAEHLGNKLRLRFHHGQWAADFDDPDATQPRDDDWMIPASGGGGAAAAAAAQGGV